MSAILAAQAAARKAQESTYFGLVTVTEYQKVKDERSKLTSGEEVIVLEAQPCHLSFESLAAATQTESVASVAQGVKLFLSPDVTVKAGSKVTVTQDGVTTDYVCSGVPAVYATHQEINLELFKGWA